MQQHSSYHFQRSEAIELGVACLSWEKNKYQSFMYYKFITGWAGNKIVNRSWCSNLISTWLLAVRTWWDKTNMEIELVEIN